MKKFFARCFHVLHYHHKLNWIPDKLFIQLQYYSRFGKFPDLKNPKTYNEKLQWIKLHDRKPEYTPLVDKLLVKDYIAEKLGSDHVIPTIQSWDSPEEIDFDSLPEKFVLKCNHNSGGVIVCRDKSKLDRKKTVEKLSRYLKEDFYFRCREWPYRNVKRKVFAETYMEDEATSELRDYKFFVFSGKVKALCVVCDRTNPETGTKLDYFDENYQHLPLAQLYQNADTPPEKPACFDEMKRLAEMLGQGYAHIRVDFYVVNGNIYFGELTFFSGGGLQPFEPPHWDEIFGSWLELPEKTV